MRHFDRSGEIYSEKFLVHYMWCQMFPSGTKTYFY